MNKKLVTVTLHLKTLMKDLLHCVLFYLVEEISHLPLIVLPKL